MRGMKPGHLLPLMMLAATTLPALADDVLMPADQDVAGVSQAQWSRQWWQWAMSFAGDASPVADRTGALCGSGQQGPVWFLAGAYGSQRVVRECSVPADKYLFFPLIDYVDRSQLGHPLSCSISMRNVRELTDNATNLVLRIDGVLQPGLEAHRLDSLGCFNLGARGEPPKSIFPVAANGYYVMLRPLTPGTHELEFGGWLPDMAQAISYTLHVR